MRLFVLVCNAVSVAFTLLVVASDGPPTQPAYVFFGILLILVPVFTLLTLASPRLFSAKGTPAFRLAAVCNLLLLAFVGWALVDQHPHPNEPGFIPYAILMLMTPTLSAVVLFRHHPNELPHA